MDDYTRGLVAGVIIGAGSCLVFFGYLLRRFIDGIVIDVHRPDGPLGS